MAAAPSPLRVPLGGQQAPGHPRPPVPKVSPQRPPEPGSPPVQRAPGGMFQRPAHSPQPLGGAPRPAGPGGLQRPAAPRAPGGAPQPQRGVPARPGVPGVAHGLQHGQQKTMGSPRPVGPGAPGAAAVARPAAGPTHPADLKSPPPQHRPIQTQRPAAGSAAVHTA
eukprot:223051_1